MVQSGDFFQMYARLEPPAVLNFDPAKKNQGVEKSSDIVTFLKIHNQSPIAEGKNLAYKIKTTAPKSY